MSYRNITWNGIKWLRLWMLFPKIPKNMTESNKGQNLDRWKRFISLIDTKKSINNLLPLLPLLVTFSDRVPSGTINSVLHKICEKKMCSYKRQTLNYQLKKNRFLKWKQKVKAVSIVLQCHTWSVKVLLLSWNAWFTCPPQPCCYGEIYLVTDCCRRPIYVTTCKLYKTAIWQ